MTLSDRHGAKQPGRFNPASAARLDDPARLAYLPPAELVALLALEPAMTVVDFGAGTGTYAVEIARLRPDVRVIAVDEQAAMLERMAAKFATAGFTNVQTAGLDRLPELAGTADRILALNVLHELGDAALADVARILAPAGKAVFVDWNADVERPHGPPAAHVYGVDAARARLTQADWRIERSTTFPYHHAFIAFRDPER